MDDVVYTPGPAPQVTIDPGEPAGHLSHTISQGSLRDVLEEMEKGKDREDPGLNPNPKDTDPKNPSPGPSRDQGTVPEKKVAPVGGKIVKILDPAQFFREKEKLEEWIIQVRVKFMGNGHLFPHKLAKIIYIVNLLDRNTCK